MRQRANEWNSRPRECSPPRSSRVLMVPLTNIAPSSHPEHLLGLQGLQLAQRGGVHQLDLNRHLPGSNSVQTHSVFLEEVRIPESKDRDKEMELLCAASSDSTICYRGFCPAKLPHVADKATQCLDPFLVTSCASLVRVSHLSEEPIFPI